MKNQYFSEVCVPIQIPYGFRQAEKEHLDFTFDREDRFTDFRIEKDGQDYDVSLDNNGQWYFFTSLVCDSLDELKLSRQIFRPPYLRNEEFPLVDIMENVISSLYMKDMIKHMPTLWVYQKTCLLFPHFGRPDWPIMMARMIPRLLKKSIIFKRNITVRVQGLFQALKPVLLRPSRKMITTQGKFTCPIMQELI
ncbi:hypothetical protein [Cytobacillus oceanisediminis]|uniref:hypothetical protein n=1 Tax=Cytobacillus oceanisediminis TaxID=665099 RepID=UPI000ABB3CAA|nr:hypothetical protein [Cytobacillus oceanisediminis]